MSWIDEFKGLFSHHAGKLEDRLGGIENQLSEVAKSSDQTARNLDFEVKTVRFTIKEALSPKIRELLTVPPGVYYELTHWTWKSGANSLPGLFLQDGSQLLDVPTIAEAAHQGKRDPNELVIAEGQVLLVSDLLENEGEITLVLQFRVYQLAATHEAQTGSGG